MSEYIALGKAHAGAEHHLQEERKKSIHLVA